MAIDGVVELAHRERLAQPILGADLDGTGARVAAAVRTTWFVSEEGAGSTFAFALPAA
jgi:hypothetical protein